MANSASNPHDIKYLCTPLQQSPSGIHWEAFEDSFLNAISSRTDDRGHRVLKVSFLPLTKVLGVAHVDVVALTGGPLIHTVVVLKVSLELVPKFLVYGEVAKSD